MCVCRMMTGCRMGAGLALALLLVGCHTTYRYSYEPSVKGEAKTLGRYHLQSWRVVSNGKDEPSQQATGRGGMDRIHSMFPDVFSEAGTPVDVVVHIDDDKFSYSPIGISGFFMLFSAGIIPCWNHWDGECRIQLFVGGGSDKAESEFSIAIESRESSSSLGLNRLFPYKHRSDLRFSREGESGSGGHGEDERDSCRADAYAYGIAATLAQMERNGKLSGVMQRQASQEKTEANAKEPAASGRAFELRQLLNAGVISEAEYRLEMKQVKPSDNGSGASSVEVYFVRSGDTLRSIADACGMSVQQLKDLNHLDSDRLRVGQKLVVKGVK